MHQKYVPNVNMNSDKIRAETLDRDHDHPLRVPIGDFEYCPKTRSLVSFSDKKLFYMLSDNGWYDGLVIIGIKKELIFSYNVHACKDPIHNQDAWQFVPHPKYTPVEYKELRVYIRG